MINIREELLKSQLRETIKQEAYLYKKDGFLLQSGKISNHYINMKKLLHNQCFLYLLTSLIVDYIKELKFLYNITINGLGGPGYGALPMATGTIIRLVELNDYDNIYSFSIRDKKKKHGVENFFDGPINEFDNVMILDDVITTGNNIKKTIDICLGNNLRPIAIFSIINRENLNLQSLSNMLLSTKNLFTLEDFI